jgi:hypothetical protein
MSLVSLTVAELQLTPGWALVHAQAPATAADEALGATPAMTCQQEGAGTVGCPGSQQYQQCGQTTAWPGQGALLPVLLTPAKTVEQMQTVWWGLVC